MKKSIRIISFSSLLFVFFSFTTKAQDDTARFMLGKFQADDMTAVTEMFKTIDKRKYHFRFANERKTYGEAILSATEMAEINRVKKLTTKSFIIHFTNAVVVCIRDGSLIYTISPSRTGASTMLGLLGQERTTKLKTILAKYIEDPDI